MTDHAWKSGEDGWTCVICGAWGSVEAFPTECPGRAPDRPVTRDELRLALRALRYDAHYAYVLGDARDPATERAAERLRFVERFAELLGLDLGAVDER